MQTLSFKYVNFLIDKKRRRKIDALLFFTVLSLFTALCGHKLLSFVKVISTWWLWLSVYWKPRWDLEEMGVGWRCRHLFCNIWITCWLGILSCIFIHLLHLHLWDLVINQIVFCFWEIYDSFVQNDQFSQFIWIYWRTDHLNLPKPLRQTPKTKRVFFFF